MKQINSFNLSRLLAGANLSFHHRNLMMIEEVTPEALHVTEYYPRYKEIIGELNNSLVYNSRLPKTRELKKIDDIRDAYLRKLFRDVKMAMNNPDAEMSRMGNELWYVMSGYEGISGYEMNKQTEFVTEMIERLKEPDKDYLSFIDSVSGSRTFAAIESENESFKTMMDSRIEGMPERNRGKYPALRKELNQIYRDMRTKMNGFAIAASTQKIESFIDNNNKLIDEYVHVLSGMKRGGTGNEALPTDEYFKY